MTKKTVWAGGQKATFWVDLDENGVGELQVECGSLDGLSDEELCRLSIGKWETLVQAYEEGATRARDGAADTCAFCHKYLGVVCLGCPVRTYAGGFACIGTPYRPYRNASSCSTDAPALKRMAGEEVAFLNEVLDYIRKENKHE